MLRLLFYIIFQGERIYPENIYEDKSVFGLEVKILKKNVLYDYVHEVRENITIFIFQLCVKLEDLIRRVQTSLIPISNEYYLGCFGSYSDQDP